VNMEKWLAGLRGAPVKKPLPLLSFPSAALMGVTVRELISDAGLQARGMELIARRVPSAAAVSMMDLSVEAEAFGSRIRVTNTEVPTVVGAVVGDAAAADALKVPQVGAGRTGIYVDAIRQAVGLVSDRPVFAGVIGPFSLTGRLVGVTDAMILCYEEPELIRTVLDKASEFIIRYCLAFRAAGCGGVVMAEPLTGLLSPALAEEFSEPWVRRITDAVRDEGFLVIYHNCGGGTVAQLDSILRTGASAFHFGDAVRMKDVMEKLPPEATALGNVSPAREFFGGTPASVRAATLELLAECGGYPNFILSSGCDIPPLSPWENIGAFFAAADEYYRGRA